jgi:hypothetical protein
MDSDKLNMQTTVYGAACVERAKMKHDPDDDKRLFQLWDNKDLENLGLDQFGISLTEEVDEYDDDDDDDDDDKNKGKDDASDTSTGVKSESDLVPGPGTGRKAGKRAFICGFHDWGEECATTKSSDSYDRLMDKYGDIWFHDGDIKYTIDSLMWFSGSGRYSLKCIRDDYDKTKTDAFNKGKFDWFDISSDTVGAIWTSHYERRLEDGLSQSMEYDKFRIVRDDSTIDDDGNWIAWAKKKAAEKKKPAAKSKQTTPKKRKRS